MALSVLGWRVIAAMETRLTKLIDASETRLTALITASEGRLDKRIDGVDEKLGGLSGDHNELSRELSGCAGKCVGAWGASLLTMESRPSPASTAWGAPTRAPPNARQTAIRFLRSSVWLRGPRRRR